MKHPFVGALALACVLIAVGLPAGAFAQTPIPIGEAASGVIDYVWPVVVAGLAWLVRKIPTQFAWVLTALRVDQLLNSALTYGINATKGAVKGRTLTLPVGNEVARIALEYAMAHAPQLVAMFGIARMREKILARLEFDEETVIAPPAVATK